MHIMEGFLPASHCALWGAVAAPFVALGASQIVRQVRNKPETRLHLAAAGAFAFVLSALKIPSVTGSCSHPTGTGLGAVMFGPSVMAVLGALVLVFQALLLAHGGLSTLGANIVSMAIVGPWVSFGIWRLLPRLGLSANVALFAAASLGDMATYLTTSAQLALAYPDPLAGFGAAFIKFAGIFALTQVPLAIAEGLLTVVVAGLLTQSHQQQMGAQP